MKIIYELKVNLHLIKCMMVKVLSFIQNKCSIKGYTSSGQK